MVELAMISSAWHDTGRSVVEGMRRAKEIGFDAYDLHEDPLDLDAATRAAIKDASAELELPIRSNVCIALGLVDFTRSVREFTLDRCRAFVDLQAELGGRNVLMVVGEYYWGLEVHPAEKIFGLVAENVRELAQYAADKDIELAIELEPYDAAVVASVDDLVRFLDAVDHPAVKANADISHLHLTRTPFEDVARLAGRIGHVHVSDCNGEVHGDLPPGRGVTPIKEYLRAVFDTGFDGTVALELEFSPNPADMDDWVEEAYSETARILDELGVRAAVPAVG